MDNQLFQIALTIAGFLLGIIAFFLSRLLGQFDRLTSQVISLNNTMLKIDGDLNGDLGVIRTRLDSIQGEVTGLDAVWDRLRAVESKVAVVEQGGCEIVKQCRT